MWCGWQSEAGEANDEGETRDWCGGVDDEVCGDEGDEAMRE